jgi:metal-sulfur cluster biosynthetic enzyme
MDEAAVKNALREVIDPEVGLDVVSLGLVYRVAFADGGIQVDMTMTSPTCPLGDFICAEAKTVVVRRFPEAKSVSVQLVWEPRWNPSMIEPGARGVLGGD